MTTGTNTIASHFSGPWDGHLIRQLTGGRLSPTRQLGRESPNKQPVNTRSGWGGRPRPKSGLGLRGKSVDEGRGMFLVKQMTGGWLRARTFGSLDLKTDNESCFLVSIFQFEAC
jgi:hypothetical protein